MMVGPGFDAVRRNGTKVVMCMRDDTREWIARRVSKEFGVTGHISMRMG